MTQEPERSLRAGATGWRAKTIRYGAGIAGACAMVLLRIWFLEPLVGTGNSYIQSHLAVLFASAMGGLVGGLLATLTSAVGIGYAILPPRYSFGVEGMSNRISLAVFVGIGTLISVLFHALQRAQSDATQSEERYRSLVELSPDALFVHIDGTIVYANASTLRLLGASDPTQLLGRSSFEFVAPAWQPLARSRTAQLKAGEKRLPRVEQEWVRLDGRVFPVEVAAVRVPWEGAEAIQVIFRDISERRRVEEDREALLQHAQAARAEAEEASRLKEEFLAVLSHELRTPLNAVLGWARMISRGVTRPDRLAHALTVIERNATAQVRLVEDLLDMSRIVTGQMQIRVQRMDLRDATVNAVESVRPAVAAKGIELRVRLPPDEVCVMGDPVRIQQVVWNLLTNAVKFTQPGGFVNVAVQRVGTNAEMTVSDTGVGISPDFLPHVFERFRQQEGGSTRPISGLGLGLALVRNLVEAHGGSVRASSGGLGTGSTFVVLLPLAGPKSAADEDAAASRDRSTRRPRGRLRERPA